ncbi:DUF3617 domain-containing protein [Isoalcanivorax indicus]|uniref:DUF3617 domain-containing protein n=1 Tax=Isoalcanivorax indicus TaxID=2202653 RepID=UPI000DBAAE26|nr:DUF3617 family protein [Isoalcanivorax indicus]
MRFPSTLLALTGLLALPFTASAADPNIQPGEWEYANVTVMTMGDQKMPPQEDSHRECVTAEDLQNIDLLAGEGMEGCEVKNMNMQRSRMRYTVSCAADDGTRYTMNADMRMNGTTSEGVIKGDMDTPMGPMSMHITVSGRRLGDC